MVQLTRDKIKTIGKDAIGAFLLKLQIYRSLADIQSAQALYNKYSEVSDSFEYPYLKFREVVVNRRKPRSLFVQSSTKIIDGNVVLKSYPSTYEGIILSFNDHFEEYDSEIDPIILCLYQKDIKYFV